MFISETEKSILLEYFMNPQDYISSEDINFLPEGKKYPDGSKITCDKDGDGRVLIIPKENFKNIIIPLINIYREDCKQHSATLINNKIYFHQNSNEYKEPLNKNIRYNVGDFFDIFNKKNSGIPVATLTKSEGINLKNNISTRKKENYYKYDTQINLDNFVKIKTVVKTATDLKGERYCLISKTSNEPTLLSINTKVRNKIGFYSSNPVISRMDQDNKLYKTIDIVPYKGKTLWNYIDDTEIDKSLLAEKLIQAYLEQIADNDLVHTDINPNNICIDENAIITYIDFENAFVFGAQISSGLGTPGYLAYEFFKKPEDCDRQLEIRGQGQRAFLDVLKPNYRELFSPATDIFALGKVLIQDLELKPTDRYYALAMQMLNNEDQRLSLESLRETFQIENFNVGKCTFK